MENETRSVTEKLGKILRPHISKSGRVHSDDKSRFAVTIEKSPEQIYGFFRDFSNLPLFMKDVEDVQVTSPTRSHWIVQVHAGYKVEWDAEIIAEREGEMISWKSLEGSEVTTSGTIWFSSAPLGMGTVVGLTMDDQVPGGKLTEMITKMSGEDPSSLAFINLRRLKCFLETGEIATIEGQPSGRDEEAEMIVKH